MFCDILFEYLLNEILLNELFLFSVRYDCDNFYTLSVRILQLYLNQGCHGTGKTGNLNVHFSRQGKHREFAKKYLKYSFTQGIYHQHRENFESQKK